MVVVLGKGDHITLAGDLQTATAGDLDMGALELCKKIAIVGEDCHVEPVSMRVTNENISRIRDVDPIGEVGDALTPDPSHEDPFLCEHDNIVALKITDIELSSAYCYVAWLPHVVGTVKPAQKVATLGDDKEGRGNTVHSHNIAIPGDGQTRHNVNVANCYLPDKVSVLGEDLHPRPLVASIANHKLARAFHHRNLARVPQLPFFLAWDAELVAEGPVLLKHLNPVVVRVRHNDLLLKTETEAMGRVELAFAWTQLSKLAPDLHRVERPWLDTAWLGQQSSHVDPRPQDWLTRSRDWTDRLTAETQARHQVVEGGERGGAGPDHARHCETQWEGRYGRVSGGDDRRGEKRGRDQGKVSGRDSVAAQVGERPRQAIPVPVEWKQQVWIWRRPAASTNTLSLHLLQLGKSGEVGEGKALLPVMHSVLALILGPAHVCLALLIAADIADQVGKGETSSSSSDR